MKIISWLIGLPLAAIIVLFALSNRQAVSIGLWPFEEGVMLPVYLAVLLSLLAGFFVGALSFGARGLKHRRDARRSAKRVSLLEGELQTRAAVPAAAGDASADHLTPPT